MKKITRMWHGKTKAEHADEYLKYVEDTGMKEYRAIKGNLSSKLLRRLDGDICHFLTVTEWDSYESIKKFAGDDHQKAKYYPEDKKYLLEFEEHVVHYETFEY
jgi:heme-degrading monooxygenase HmoA